MNPEVPTDLLIRQLIYEFGRGFPDAERQMIEGGKLPESIHAYRHMRPLISELQRRMESA
jgi:hypothetical protein